MSVNIKCKLVEKEQLKSDIFRFTCESKEIVSEVKTGQFIEIKCGTTLDPILRRPISISSVNKDNGTFQFVFQVKGKGTTLLSNYEIGDLIDIIGPLGNGYFKVKEEYKKVAIIGGGIGVFPLLELTKQVGEIATIYLGFRNKDIVVLEEDFKKYCNNVVVVTDDGSYGKKGFTTEAFTNDLQKEKFDMVYACGPKGMLKQVQKICSENNIPCQISLEELMGCGIGACLGCAIQVKMGDEFHYGHVCKNGPIFMGTEVLF